MSYSCGSCGYSSGYGQSYSRLESIAQSSSADYQSSNVNYFAEAVSPAAFVYQPQSTGFTAYKNSNDTLYQITKNQATNVEYSFIPDQFLRSDRAKRFVGEAEQIEEEIKEAFMATTGLVFPEDIQINVCSALQFKKMVNQLGVMGFSINRKEAGLTSEIFVLNDDLARVMLTIGHEIGHVLSRPLKDKRLEEAKAFAFSKAWMRAIKENNIADLRNAIIIENPAQNGLHDIAHLFVHKKTQETEPLALYWEIVRGEHAVVV